MKIQMTYQLLYKKMKILKIQMGFGVLLAVGHPEMEKMELYH